ncbi:MAG: type 1 pili tip component [Pseudomonadota bacterium]
MPFQQLLQRWQQTPVANQSESRYAIRLDVDDAARVEALAALFPGLDTETIIADLLHVALDAAEAAMPYEPSEEVIGHDDHGDPMFADGGLTPRYVELVREARTRQS